MSFKQDKFKVTSRHIIIILLQIKEVRNFLKSARKNNDVSSVGEHQLKW